MERKRNLLECLMSACLGPAWDRARITWDCRGNLPPHKEDNGALVEPLGKPFWPMGRACLDQWEEPWSNLSLGLAMGMGAYASAGGVPKKENVGAKVIKWAPLG